MEFTEGQIYRGNISLSGGNDGPTQSWIIISPFEKIHIHSIDDPLDLHCWPLFPAQKGLEGGYLKLIETNIQHPVMCLQRAKEKLGISDIHMGLQGESLGRMFELLGQAVATSQPYALYAAGEILAFMGHANHSKKEMANIKEQVNKHLQVLECMPIT